MIVSTHPCAACTGFTVSSSQHTPHHCHCCCPLDMIAKKNQRAQVLKSPQHQACRRGPPTVMVFNVQVITWPKEFQGRWSIALTTHVHLTGLFLKTCPLPSLFATRASRGSRLSAKMKPAIRTPGIEHTRLQLQRHTTLGPAVLASSGTDQNNRPTMGSARGNAVQRSLLSVEFPNASRHMLLLGFPDPFPPRPPGAS